jgi:hypothetical protein
MQYFLGTCVSLMRTTFTTSYMNSLCGTNFESYMNSLCVTEGVYLYIIFLRSMKIIQNLVWLSPRVCLPRESTSPLAPHQRPDTPVFSKKIKCKCICMPGSCFMHIVIYMCIETVSRKKGDYQSLCLILETKTPYSTSNRLRSRTPRTPQHLHVIFM